MNKISKKDQYQSIAKIFQTQIVPIHVARKLEDVVDDIVDKKGIKNSERWKVVDELMEGYRGNE